MPEKEFNPKRIEEMIKTDENKEIKTYDSDFVPERYSNASATHQPFVVAIDTSHSMTNDAGNGKSKLQTCEDLLNDLPKNAEMTRLSVLDKESIDMLTLSFSGDDVLVQAPWQPISQFEGIGHLKAGSTTPLYKTIVESIEATRVIRQDYASGDQGVSCYRPQIFIYTDGLATDNENRDLAKQKCEKYLDKDENQDQPNAKKAKAKMFVILIPGSMTEAEIQSVSKDIQSLSKEIVIIKAKDCANGLPASFQFLASSVVVGQSSSVGEHMKVKFDRNNLAVTKKHTTDDDFVDLDVQDDQVEFTD